MNPSRRGIYKNGKFCLFLNHGRKWKFIVLSFKYGCKSKHGPMANMELIQYKKMDQFIVSMLGCIAQEAISLALWEVNFHRRICIFKHVGFIFLIHEHYIIFSESMNMSRTTYQTKAQNTTSGSMMSMRGASEYYFD